MHLKSRQREGERPVETFFVLRQEQQKARNQPSRYVAGNFEAVILKTSENYEKPGKLWENIEPLERSTSRRVVRHSKTLRQERRSPKRSNGIEMTSLTEAIKKKC